MLVDCHAQGELVQAPFSPFVHVVIHRPRCSDILLAYKTTDQITDEYYGNTEDFYVHADGKQQLPESFAYLPRPVLFFLILIPRGNKSATRPPETQTESQRIGLHIGKTLTQLRADVISRQATALPLSLLVTRSVNRRPPLNGSLSAARERTSLSIDHDLTAALVRNSKVVSNHPCSSLAQILFLVSSIGVK